jgi:hypothetical protein
MFAPYFLALTWERASDEWRISVETKDEHRTTNDQRRTTLAEGRSTKD